MKIALVIERMETWRGGAETSATEFARLLRDAGHEVHIVTAVAPDAEPGLTMHAVGPERGPRTTRTTGFVRRATDLLARQSFDVVHAISPLPTADIYQPRGGSVRETIEQNIALRDGVIGRALKRIAIGLSLKQRMSLRLEQAICRSNGPVIAAVSQYVAEQFKRYYGLMPPRVRVVFNGVTWRATSETEREENRRRVRHQYGASADTMLLLCVAHNFKLKGVSRLIAAVDLLVRSGRSDVLTLVVGRDDARPYERQAESLGVSRRILFTGAVDDITPYLHAADVCVHPTCYDPCSRIMLEAISQGVPVVTTRQNGAAEVIEDGVHGYVLDSYRDIAGMADRIGRLADPDLRWAVRQAGEVIRPRLSMKRHVLEMIELYREVVGRGQRGR